MCIFAREVKVCQRAYACKRVPSWLFWLKESLELNPAFSFHPNFVENTTMARGAAMKKAAGNKAMTKGSIADSLANSVELKKSVTTKVLNSLAELGQAEVKKTGIFTTPGLARTKTRRKPATKATKKMMSGTEVVVKAKPAKTVVKAFAVAALKAQI